MDTTLQPQDVVNMKLGNDPRRPYRLDRYSVDGQRKFCEFAAETNHGSAQESMCNAAALLRCVIAAGVVDRIVTTASRKVVLGHRAIRLVLKCTVLAAPKEDLSYRSYRRSRS